jgi:gliding motility-associated lipoprotein GldK
MNNKSVLRNLGLSLVLIASAFLQGCGLFGGSAGDGGELVGVAGREGWYMSVPYGMISVPAGTFHMGQADEDVASSQINFNRQVTIGGFYMDDTEITNNEYRQFVTRMLEDSSSLGRDYIMQELYPDTTVWVKDFVNHMGDPMMEYYYMHPAFDDFPVVGVDWEAANFFAKWRTDYLNAYRESLGEFPMPAFRLPSEAEWEYIRNAKGCMLANFKPGRGNYFDDGYAYTAQVAEYFPNDWGLYDMSGNVAEWCEDAYNPASVPLVWDLNPTFYDENEPRKIIRGGSWKDIAYYLETGTRAFEHKDSSRAFIGFRCAMTYLGRSAGTEF